MLTADNVEEWVAWLNSGAEGTLEGNARASHVDGILTLELLGVYAGLNGNLCFLSREAGSPYEGDHRFSGGADGHGVLKHLHRYAATVPPTGLDLSGITVDTYASAEVWLDCAPSSGLVSWPPDWSWVGGTVPPQSFTQNTRLLIDVMSDGRTVVANFKHYYTYV